jgi:hypothetical protein
MLLDNKMDPPELRIRLIYGYMSGTVTVQKVNLDWVLWERPRAHLSNVRC